MVNSNDNTNKCEPVSDPVVSIAGWELTRGPMYFMLYTQNCVLFCGAVKVFCYINFDSLFPNMQPPTYVSLMCSHVVDTYTFI